ncbi:MAG: hypothetical protein ABI591_12115 [Kofleriaceae bacterium]
MIGEALAVAAHRLGADGAAVLARLGGVIGDDARAAASTHAALAPHAARARRAQWLATARLAAPAGFRAIHASWIEAALVDRPARTRSAVANGGDAVDLYLARWALAGFVAMPATTSRAHRPAELPGLDPEALRAWLERAGADQLARAAQLAGGDVLALAERDPALVAALDRIARPPRLGQLGSDRAIVKRCAGIANDDVRLVRLGARAVAPHLDGRVRRQLVQRLPRALAIGNDLHDFAADPHPVSWSALA